MRTLVSFILLLVPSLAMAQSKPPSYPPPGSAGPEHLSKGPSAPSRSAGEPFDAAAAPAVRGRAAAPLKIATERGGAFPKRAALQIATPDELWRKIRAADAADLQYAKALADSVGSAAARERAACYEALIVIIAQAQGAGLKDANGNALTQPDPHVFSSFEQLAEVAEALQPTGPLMAACAPAWTALKLSAFEFFTLAVSGAAGLSALGGAIP
jgi:hypothetical protein